jgi:aldose 1-epimerase
MAHPPTATFETRDGVDLVRLSTAEDVYATVAPALGFNCYEFVAGLPVLEEVAFETFAAKPTSYGIPIMFPFPNRIRDGRFTFRGRTFTVDPPRHGMVRDKRWRVVDSGATEESGAWVRGRFEAADAGDVVLSQFPFPFGIDVTYRLKGRALGMEVDVANHAEDDMPYGFGIHPYFRRPDAGTLTVPATSLWELDESMPTGRIVSADGCRDLRHAADVSALSLDDVYTALETSDDGSVRCELVDGESGAVTAIEFLAATFPHVVVYTAPEPRRAICVEPQTCPTDAFNLAARGIASDVRVLGPGAREHLELRISA